MPVRCHCKEYECNGKLVPPQTRINHQRADLRSQTASHQNSRRFAGPPIAPIAGPSSALPVLPGRLYDAPAPPPPPSDFPEYVNASNTLIEQPIIDNDISSGDGSEVLALQTQTYTHHPFFDPDPGQAVACLTQEHQDDLGCYDDQEEPLEEDHAGPLVLDANEDNPDPFVVERDGSDRQRIPAAQQLPDYLLAIHATVAWLHLQFNLPRIACNAVLVIMASLITFLVPGITPPFRTLRSATRTLGVDQPIELLAVCPTCRDVFPSANSKHMQDMCTTCKTPLFLGDYTKRNNSRASKTPIVKYPYLALSEQIASILRVPGIEALLDEWRKKPRKTGEYVDIFDGNICRNKLRAPDGSLFFSNLPHENNGPQGELRIGVNLGLDWFSYIRSNIAPSHSSCPTSFSICNLPPEFRYRTSNLLCTSIIPGPKEQNPDEIQRFLRPMVSDLLRLWTDGIKVPTESCPEGRLVRIILVAVVCDKPAAHKVGGFGSHSHTNFCTLCWITTHDKSKPAAFKRGAFPPRTDEDHRRLGEEYRKLESPTARKTFVKDRATRYTQLSRLPYFNLVDQIIIDPMHNLFLGLVKTHFYGIWVQHKILRANHELEDFHNMLADFTVPRSCGRLPTDIGVPSGGSLTADQWLLLSTVYGPVLIPQLWSSRILKHGGNSASMRRLISIAAVEEEKAREASRKAEDQRILASARSQGKEAYSAAKALIAQEREAAVQAKKIEKLRVTAERQAEKARVAAENKARQLERKAAKRKATSQTVEGIAEGEQRVPPPPVDRTTVDADDHGIEPGASHDKFTLHPDDPANFLKLSSALRLLVRRRLTDSEIDDADHLIREYCTELLPLYGSGVVKPNHHYATHVADCARNFGPLHGFWTFLFERLNRVLKSFNTNNHGQGELETTFFTEFQKTCQTSRLIYTMLRFRDNALPSEIASIMLKATNEERGTVAGLASLLETLDDDPEHADGSVPYAFSPRHHTKNMSSDTYRLLANTICSRFPSTPVHCRSNNPVLSNSLPLERTAVFFDYVVVDGKRYHASHTVGCNKSSFIHVLIPGPCPVNAYGELLEVFQFNQDFRHTGSSLRLAHVRWFKPWTGERESVWDDFKVVNVRLWELGEYQDHGGHLPDLIDPRWIEGQLARTTVSIGPSMTKAWATVDLAKVHDLDGSSD